MSSSPKPAPPWRDSAPASTAPSAAWRAAAPRIPYRARWWKLAAISIAGLLTLATATWAVLWIHPPEPAFLLTLAATYDNTLAIPSHPYGKLGTSELASLTAPGGFLGARSRAHGRQKPGRLTQLGLPDLSGVREKCIVVVIAAHGGRDRDGAFLFPEDANGEAASRLRVKTILKQLAQLPAGRHKLLILDATEPPAYADLGLVHNDFASAVESLEGDIAAVPNLAVFMSSGVDQQSWTSPEWGASAFMHYLSRGMHGAADSNGDSRISGSELVEYVRPRVRDWARDNRGALQTPVLLPRGEEGMRRAAAMRLSMTDAPPPDETAPPPFALPVELEQAWREYQDLAAAYPPPKVYTPHLWRQYEAWVLRLERAIVAGDREGMASARSRASDIKRQMEAARRLEIGPQTLSLPSGLGGVAMPPTAPKLFRQGIEQLAALPAVERTAAWAKLRETTGFEPAVSRLLWCRALIEWTAGDPLTRLPLAPSLVSLLSDGLAVRPAEINLLIMLARHLPPTDTAGRIGPLLNRILLLRLAAEDASQLTMAQSFPYPEWLATYSREPINRGDLKRRNAEDLCFATSPTHWQQAEDEVNGAEREYRARVDAARSLQELIVSWHQSAALLPGYSEWLARDSSANTLERVPRELMFQALTDIWKHTRETASTIPRLVSRTSSEELATAQKHRSYVAIGLKVLDELLAGRIKKLLPTKSEYDAPATPRGTAVSWLRDASDALTAPIPAQISPKQRAVLIGEYRRVSQQLLVTGWTQPEPLPEVSPGITRELAFSAARRRGFLFLNRFTDRPEEETQRPAAFPQQVASPREQPETPEYRFNHFAFEADGRQSLAEASSQCGELLAKATSQAAKIEVWEEAERQIRILPAHAEVSDAPIARHRREQARLALAEQARRTYLDNWYGEGGARYYRTAIEHLASDAEKLGGNPPENTFKQLLSREAAFPVAVKAPRRLVITDQPDPKLTLTFHRPANSDILGYPVFWMMPQTTAESRLPITLDSQTAVPDWTGTIARPATPPPRFPVAETSAIKINGFFRGRSSETLVPIDFYRLPDRAVSSGLKLKSTAIAVRADPTVRAKYGYGSGAVAIVLDCSGSMGPVNRKNPLDRGLYPEAVRALNLLLEELPPGTLVNVWVFGQKFPGVSSPEETILEVLPPTPLPANRKDLLDDVNARVAYLEPWDLSPIVRAVVAARERIERAEVPFKAVVLISDGVDTRYDSDPKNPKKRAIKDALRAEFPPHGVALSILALPVIKSEAGFQAEFKIVSDLKPAGKFVQTELKPGLLQEVMDLPERVKELSSWLRNGLNPRVRYTLEPLERQSTQADLRAGSETSDNWYRGRLEPGTYRFQMRDNPAAAATVQMAPGDRLLLDLQENRGVVELKRHWYADSAPGNKSGRSMDAWRMNLLQNRYDAGGLRLFTAIEDRPAKSNPATVARIGDVWFDLHPVLPNPARISAHWRPSPGFPSPTWSIDVNGWPMFPGSKSAASPFVEAWWSLPGGFAAQGSITVSPGKSIFTLAGRQETIAGTSVTVESIAIEDQLIGGKPVPEKCLAVRLSHPSDCPVLVRPLGATATGSEVRVYRGANSVTCLFPGIDSEAITGFDVVVLNDALKQAELAGRHAQLDNVPTPSDTSPRPEPPVDIR